MSYTMHKADVCEWAKTYSGPKFHALLTDCPYEMEFMGRQWDRSGVSFQAETWSALAEHLLPGAFLLVCAGTINDDLISVAMRQAGLRKYHKAMAWGYGSGFPKATRLDVQLDRRAGAERQIVGTRKHAPKFDAAGFEYRKKDNGYNSKERQSFDVTAPATALAADWAGYRYGGQMLKPALESILIFQKPYDGRPVDSIAATGAGALNIDGGRIEGAGAGWNGLGDTHDESQWRLNRPDGIRRGPTGRWPANLVLIHSPRCDAAGCADDCPARRLGEQSGDDYARNGGTNGKNGSDTYSGNRGAIDTPTYRDTGTAARYFYQADWQLDAADPLYYCAKASRAEREAGLDPRAVAFMRLIDDSDEGELPEYDMDHATYGEFRGTPEHGAYSRRARFDETTVDDGRQTPIDNPYLRGETKRRNPHPTVKPLSLTRYLATLLLPPERYAPRRLLVPFAGVASEVIGGMLAGWDEVIGVELDDDGLHVPVANARISYWLQRRAELRDPSKPITIKAASKTPQGQRDMFDESEAA